MHYNLNFSKKIIIPLYIPWILSELTTYDPVTSYFIAWGGSFFIFYLTITSPLRHISNDLPANQQIMRPIVLIQLIFAGFMCSTSIFYFLDHMGYKYLSDISSSSFSANDQTFRIAQCQRLSLLAHTALSTGIIFLIKKTTTPKYKINLPLPKLMLWICLFSSFTGVVFPIIPGFFQMRQPLLNISFSCIAYLFISGCKNKNYHLIFFAGIIFVLNLLNAATSGFKEALILNFIQMAFIAYPWYRRIVAISAIPLIYLLLFLLPTFNAVIRTQSWIRKKPKGESGIEAYHTLFDEENEQKIIGNNWEFLTKRFSEISMFTRFVKQVPDQYPYYGLQIIENSLVALVPRVLWQDKPNTERLAMERVYKAGVASRSSNVSAKTRPVVDAYLIAGSFGVFIVMLIYGMCAQLICNISENKFGGYHFGCIIIFNSIFQSLWRGNTLEFLINNILYGYILMLLIHWVLKKLNAVVPVRS